MKKHTISFLEYEANPINDRDRVTQLISNHAMPSDLVEKFKANVGELKEEDIIFVTGVGLMYPFINQKSILTVFHSFFKNNPVVYFLPGEYDGKVIKLFNTVEIDNYYRAFKLVEEGE